MIKKFNEFINEGKSKEDLKADVIAKLILWGNNPDDVQDMVDKHFHVAIRSYSSPKKIAEYIRTVY